MANNQAPHLLRDDRLAPHPSLWTCIWFTVYHSTQLPDCSVLSRLKSEHLDNGLCIEVYSEPYDKDIIDNKRDFVSFSQTKYIGKASFKTLMELRKEGVIREQWDKLYSSILEGAKRLMDSPRKDNLEYLPLPNGDLIAYIKAYFEVPLPQYTVEKHKNGTIRRKGISEAEVARMIKPHIVKAISHLVNTGKINLDATARVNDVKDKAIRDAFDEITNGVRLPAFGKKRFYYWVEELGFDWVRDDFGQLLRPTNNQRILAMFDVQGRPIATLLSELRASYGLDKVSATDL